jgi:coenzyme F420-0:L-glutamate ligase / coenzyme F420-1:gamma-L-glutamate ligase
MPSTDPAARDTASLHRFLRSRSSVRSFSPEPVATPVLDRILESATWAPSAHNRQPWRFAVVSDPRKKQEVAEAMGERLRADRMADADPQQLIEADVARSRMRMEAAPVLVFVLLTMEDMDRYPDARRQSAELTMSVQSTAMAAQNLLLAAHAEGLATCVMCAPLFCPATVLEALQLPVDWVPQFMVAMGHPRTDRVRKGRRPVDEVVVRIAGARQAQA